MVSGSGGRISFGGLASGLDTNSIIEQLMAVAQRPIALATRQRNTLETKSTAIGKVASALSALQARVQTLNTTNTYRTRVANVLAATADANKVSVTASPGAAIGGFTLSVTALATATRATSSQAAGASVGVNAPLDTSGMSPTVVAGTFSINGTSFSIDPATAEALTSQVAVGAATASNQTLAAAGLDIPVAASGTFTVNGETITWADTDTINDVIGYINASAADVTASFDANTRQLVITHNTLGTGQAITVADTTGNFLETMKLVNGGGGVIGTVTAGVDMPSLTDVVNDINGAAIGVTATIENDALGRPNLLQIAGASPVQLGSAGDTSNFLAAASLLASPPGNTRISQRGLGGLDISADLADARLATALTQSTGTFKVNGVSFDYDDAVDSIGNIVSRINSSAAGVTASYDPFTDGITLTNNTTGAIAVAVEDVTGNFLAAAKIIGATQTIGTNAAYSVNGGATRYSTSNVIEDALTGVAITVRDITTQPVKVDITVQTQTVVDAITQFVSAYNDATKVMSDLSKYDPTGKQNGVLFGDGTVRQIQTNLRRPVTSAVAGLTGSVRSMSDIGVSFGAVGSALGTTDTLQFDSAKLIAALKTQPEAVATLFTAFVPAASLNAGGTGSIASVSGTPTQATRSGTYSIVSSATGALTATFTPNDGSAAVTTTGNITAGGTNTTLIPGVTLTGQPALVAGTDVIVISAAQQGFAKTLVEYIGVLTKTGGLLKARTDEMANTVSDIDEQIAKMEARLEVREQQLVKKFTQMEQIVSKMQSQQQALTQMQAQTRANNS
jgi:flagellar hook-associated protein 2